MQRIKGVSSRKLKALIGRQGKFWEQDYYDKNIRDRDHFLTVYHYIKENPLKLLNKKDIDKRFFSIFELK